MVDTPRTQAALIAASADNTTGNYSNQNQRDFIVSTVNVAPVRSNFTTSKTLALTDISNCSEMNSTSATTVTIPPNSSVAFPVGVWTEVYQANTGQVSIVAGAGVTIVTPSTLILLGQYAQIRLLQRAANVWVLSDELQPLAKTSAQRVGDFLNSMGINTHIEPSETVYMNLLTLLGDLQFIGATFIRDKLLTSASNSATFKIYSYLAQNGIGLVLLSPTAEDAPTLVVADCVNAAQAIAQTVTGGGIIGLEQPNEPPGTNYIYNGVTITQSGVPGYLPLANFMSAYYTALKANAYLKDIPVIHATAAGGFDPVDDGLSWLTVPNGYQHLTLTSNAVTTASTTLHFAATVTDVIAGTFVYTSAATNGVSLGTVVSTTATTVVLSATTTQPSGTAFRFAARVADATKFSDVVNVHIYPTNGGGSQIPPLFGYSSGQSVDPTLPQGGNFFLYTLGDMYFTPSGFSNSNGPSEALLLSYPKWVTEYGYPTAGITGGGEAVDTTTQAKNLMTAWLNAWQTGIERFIIYSLYDDQPTPPIGLSFGLFTFARAAKLSATYMHNFITILADAAVSRNSFSCGSLGYAMTNMPSPGGSSVLFQAASGVYFLILWNNINNWNVVTGAPITIGNTTVSVSFEKQGVINVYDPTVGTAAQATAAANAVSVSLSDYPMIVSFS